MDVGEFGRAYFPIKKNGFERNIMCYGTIIEMDGRLVLFRDNDGYDYLIKTKDFEFKEEKWNDHITARDLDEIDKAREGR